MNLDAEITRLQSELKRVDTAIAALETLQEHPPRRRAGRKFMAPAERAEVSERMRRYWAGRRAQNDVLHCGAT